MASAKGELSLVVAKVGQETRSVSSAVFPIVGVVTIITTFMTPYVLRFGSRLRIMSSIHRPPSSTSTQSSSSSTKPSDNSKYNTDNGNEMKDDNDPSDKT
ncbi:MAG: hypothetical protein ACRD5B_12125 [Nitrososphaeraceae archaeon]